jgi:DNA-directed RNA polymerase II subunit RPB1
MNMHVPQSVEAATELREIAAVPNQMISPRLSKPLISIVQDTLVGVNRLTRPTEFFTQREYMNLLVHSKRWDGKIPPPAKTDPVPMWSGQQVVSALLPSIYIACGNKVWDKTSKSDQNYVIINNGKIEQGILDGDIFEKALIHILYNDFSPEMTVDFIDSLQAVVAAYLQNNGFSVGLSDLMADADTLATIATDMNKLKKEIEAMQLQLHTGLFDNASGRTNQEEFESKVFQTLDKAIGAAGKTGLKSLAANNRMVNMVKCGSKGADLNIAQMIALLGQQSIEGKRIGYGFQDRTLPHFKRYDDGAEARGFIESSFVKGLTPAEFFFHAMTGREGLIDTAVKSVTADTEIVVLEGGRSKTVHIGDWIDSHLEQGLECSSFGIHSGK